MTAERTNKSSVPRYIAQKLLNKVEVEQDVIRWSIEYRDRLGNKLRNEDYSLATGSSGIALFFLELYKAQTDPMYLGIVQKSVAGVLRTLELEPSRHYGFMYGKMGVVYLLIAVYKITKDEKYLQSALTHLENCEEFLASPQTDNSFYGGRAGVLSVLIDLLNLVPDNVVVQNLIQTAVRTIILEGRYVGPCVSWYLNSTQSNDICGFGYGASGIALVLLKAFKCLHSRFYLEIAEMAFAYCDSRKFRRWHTWPDYNNRVETPEDDMALVTLAKKGGLKSLREGRASADYDNGALGIVLAKLYAKCVVEQNGWDVGTSQTIQKIHGDASVVSIRDMSAITHMCNLTGIPLQMQKEASASLAKADELECSQLFNLSEGLAGFGYYHLIKEKVIEVPYFDPFDLKFMQFGRVRLQTNGVDIHDRLKSFLIEKYFPKTSALLSDGLKDEWHSSMAKAPHSETLEAFIKFTASKLKRAGSKSMLPQTFRLERTKYRMLSRNRYAVCSFVSRYITFVANRRLQKFSNERILAIRYVLNDDVKLLKTHVHTSGRDTAGYVLLAPDDTKDFITEKALNDFDELLLNFRSPIAGKDLVDHIVKEAGMRKARRKIELKVVDFLLLYVQEGVLLPLQKSLFQ